MSENKIPIAAIRRLTIHDGPGIRDTVFVKGCPLNCIWCHNPECISGAKQLLYHANLCKNCGACGNACPENAHVFFEGIHQIDRTKCRQCGACVNACFFAALELCGEGMTVDEVFTQVVKDRDFYLPDGGVTLSGGEPALYPEFAAELFEKLKSAGIHTALDTCGAVDFGCYQKILPHTDLVLFDLKGMDAVRHLKHTGMDNLLIHENLRKISRSGTPVEIRMPIVPGCNDFTEDIVSAAKLLSGLDSIVRIRLLPYHALAENKYAAAGMHDTMPDAETPDLKRLKEISDLLSGVLSRPIPVEFD